MTRSIFAIVSGAALLASSGLSADDAQERIAPAAADQPAHPLKPLLWKIEGGDLTKPSYLFGTIHLGSGPLATLHPAAAAAFKASDAVHTEVPMDMKSMLASSRHMMRKDGKSLDDAIGEECARQLGDCLKGINPGLDAKPFQPMKTWIVAVALPTLESQMKGEKPMDLMLWGRATKAGKKTAGIETSEKQYGMLDSFTEEEQVLLLKESLRIMSEAKKNGRDEIKVLVDAYVKGEPELVKKEMDRQIDEMRAGEHKALGERTLKLVLTDRDTTMAASIAATLAAEPGQCHFFAAGAAHFIGGTSIRAHLEEKGYRVSRIEE